MANLIRRFAVGLELPRDNGVLAEWTWSNWCALPGAYSWHVSFGPPDGNAGADLAVDRFPPCVEPALPTSLRFERFAPGLSGEITPAPACLGKVETWLCEFATFIAVRASGWETYLTGPGGLPGTYTCPLAQRAGLTVLCDGRADGTTVSGYPVSGEGDGVAIRRGDEVASQFTDLYIAPGPPSLAATGCLAEAGDCTTFAVALRTSSAFPLVYLVFEQQAGAEPGFTASALLTSSAVDLLAGEIVHTSAGDMRFTAFDPAR